MTHGTVKSLKLSYYGDTTRKYESLEKELIQGCTPGNRSRGRQRRRWTDDIIEWTGLAINEAAGSTQDRDRWRGSYAPQTLHQKEGIER